MKQITREEMLRAESNTSTLQFTSIGILIASVIVFRIVPNEAIRPFIWYWAAGMFVLATYTFIKSAQNNKVVTGYFKQQFENMKKEFDDI